MSVPVLADLARGGVSAFGGVSSVNGLTDAVSLGNANNRIINGDMALAQRQVIATFSSGSQFVCDRFVVSATGAGSVSVSQEASQDLAVDRVISNVLRINIPAGAGEVELLHKIDGARLFAGRRATFAFKARAASPGKIDRVRIQQVFGTGGSASVLVAQASNQDVVSEWRTFRLSGAVPNLDGKAIGTLPHFRLTVAPRFSGGSSAAQIIDLTDFWLDDSITGEDAAGGRFEERPPGIEQALCERYYERVPIDAAVYASAAGQQIILPLPFKVRKRASPALSFASAGTLTNCSASLSGSPGDPTGQGRLILTATAAGLVAVSGAIVAADAEF